MEDHTGNLESRCENAPSAVGAKSHLAEGHHVGAAAHLGQVQNRTWEKSFGTGWHRILDEHGCRVVFVEPDRPRAGWVACWRSRADAESGEIVRAVLLRQDEFARRVVARIETEAASCPA